MGGELRVLYVGFSMLGDCEATGKTLYNIFSNCNSIKLMQCCLDYDASFHSEIFPTNYLSRWRNPLYYFVKKIYRRNKTDVSGVPQINIKTENSIKLLVRAMLDILPKRFSRKSYQNLSDFAPQVIYTLAENISTVRMALRLSYKYNAPIVFHMMDDIESTIYSYTRYTQYFRHKYLVLLEELYQRSICNLAISPKMALVFEKKHNKPFGYAMNCIDSLHFTPIDMNKRLKLLFSGGLHGGRADSLMLMGQIIKEDKILNRLVSLVVYTSKGNIQKYSSLENVGIELKEYVPMEEMFENLSSADVLVHVESFDKKEIDFFRYSMSTKVPEYLSVGRPILCFGPMDICTVSYLAGKGVGIVANNESELKDAILRLAQNEEFRIECAKKALSTAEEHLGSVVAKRVEDVLWNSYLQWNNGE